MSKKTDLTKALFYIYILLLLWIILFKTAFSVSDIKALVYPRDIVYFPFCYGENSIPVKDAVLNCLVFIPFGIYLKMLGKKTAYAVLICAAFSFSMEMIQLVFSIGTCDATDLFTNTLGGFFGTCIYGILSLIFISKSLLNKILNITAAAVTGLFLTIVLALAVANAV